MIETGLPNCHAEQVRIAVLAWQQDTGKGYGDIASLCRLSYHAVADFMCGRRTTERTIAHLVHFLPLGMDYCRPEVRRC